MAYNSDGGWDYEDDGVAQRIASITSGSSPMMKQAKSAGMQTANRRGLGNSSMAAGASQAEAIRAAAPIASQEAQQIYGKNMAEQQGRQNADLTERQLLSTERNQMLTSMTDLAGNRMNAISGTLANDKIPASARSAVQRSFNDQFTQVSNYLQNLYGVRLNQATPTAGQPGTGAVPSAPPIAGQQGLPTGLPYGFSAAMNYY